MVSFLAIVKCSGHELNGRGECVKCRWFNGLEGVICDYPTRGRDMWVVCELLTFKSDDGRVEKVAATFCRPL